MPTIDTNRCRSPVTRITQAVNALGFAIRNKPQWERKVFDEEIVQKWRTETAEQIGQWDFGLDGALDSDDEDVSARTEEDWKLAEEAGEELPGDEYTSPPSHAAIFDLAIRRARYDAMNHPTRTPVKSIHTSEPLLPPELHDRLKTQIKRLEDIPDSKKDWHPGSGNQVLDIVHPSLWPYINCVSRAFNNEQLEAMRKENGGNILWHQYLNGGGVFNVYIKPPSTYHTDFSKMYQWLPADFAISEQGSVSVKSYINNLNPLEHADLYMTLRKVIGAFIPLFDSCIQDFGDLPEFAQVSDFTKYLVEHAYAKESMWSTLKVWDDTALKAILEGEEARKAYTLRGKKVQLILKLATTHLTPESPAFPGGSWHVEGMRNENIIASGIYYLSMENITETSLHFRMAVEEGDMGYAQDDRQGVLRVYGLKDDEPANQHLGSVECREGLGVVFPNRYQHWVAPFGLADPSKRGHRSILAVFLVDPEEPILSTSNVPPQNPGWFINYLHTSLLLPFRHLPYHVLERIVSYCGRVSLEEAKKHREDLMKERKFFINSDNEQLFERPVSLCEH
ncbi:hypothetical protein HDU85_003123 [Gaertneriomyces sp. JEL0708]|nr:hypothetical protein HDU85_003123 [Gaertneriomyces sp. JEL0708]